MSGPVAPSLRADRQEGRDVLRVYVGAEPALTFSSIDFCPDAHAQTAVALGVFAGPRDLHAYNAPVREMYQATRAGHSVKPWMGLEEAAALAAHALFRWYYVKEHCALLDTVGFDPITCGIAGGRD